jgi:PAS domain S-box-containing protein
MHYRDYIQALDSYLPMIQRSAKWSIAIFAALFFAFQALFKLVPVEAHLLVHLAQWFTVIGLFCIKSRLVFKPLLSQLSRIGTQYEQALRESEARYQLLALHSTEMITQFNPEGRITYCSPACISLTGYMPQEIVGRMVADFIYSEDRAGAEQALATPPLSGENRVLHFRLVRKDEGYVWCEAVVKGISDPRSGEITQTVASIRDYSHHRAMAHELAANQQFIQQIASTVPEIIYVYSLTQKSNIYSNRSVYEVLGYTPDEIKGLGSDIMLRLLHPDDAAQSGTYDERLAQLKDGEVMETEYRMQHRNGQWVWLQSRSTVLQRDAQGQPVLTVGTARDVTRQKLAVTQEVALKAEQARIQFLSHFIVTMSHDFRTPLTIISSSLYFLVRLQDEAKRKERVAVIEQQITHLETLMDQLSLITHLEIPGGYTFAPVALQDVISGTVAELPPDKVQRTDVDFEDVPPVKGDLVLLKLALQHLLDNAFYHSEGEVRVRAFMESEEVVILEVADSGAGIQPEELARIFDYFYRVDKARTRITGGNGLGLTIVRKIVDAHQGRIEVKSEAGKGSVFWLFLPTWQ